MNFTNFRLKQGRAAHNRKGQASLDYVLVICIILPLVAFMFVVVPRMIQLVYEMAVVTIGGPLM